MKLQEAVNLRIVELANQRKWTLNKLAERAGIAPSTLKRMIRDYGTTKSANIATILKICFACDISFKEFWDSEYFDDISYTDEA